MALLPQLLEEDIAVLERLLGQLVHDSEAALALITDKAGFRLAVAGDAAGVDTTSLASLASGSFLATQEIARIVEEPSFNSVYQQGSVRSLLVLDVDPFTLLMIVFPASQSVGVVKYYAAGVVPQIAAQMEKAKLRAPGEMIDPTALNFSETIELFRRK